MGTSFDVRFAALTCRRTYAALVVFRLLKRKGRREERFTIYDLRSLSNNFDKAILEKEKYLGLILDADSV